MNLIFVLLCFVSTNIYAVTKIVMFDHSKKSKSEVVIIEVDSKKEQNKLISNTKLKVNTFLKPNRSFSCTHSPTINPVEHNFIGIKCNHHPDSNDLFTDTSFYLYVNCDLNKSQKTASQIYITAESLKRKFEGYYSAKWSFWCKQ